jgi:hypothetical protein
MSREMMAPPPLLSPAPVRRTRLKRVLFWVIGVCSVLLLFILGVFFFRDGIIRILTEFTIERQTGLKASIGEMRLRPASSSLLIKNFRIYNPKDFGGSVLLDIPEIYMGFDPDKASNGPVHFKELRFHLAELNVVKNRKGELNLDSIKDAVGADARELNYLFGGIDKMVVTLRTIRFTDLQEPRNNYVTDLGVQSEEALNLKNENELEAWGVLLAVRIAVQEKYKADGKPRGKVGAQSLLQLLKTR